MKLDIRLDDDGVIRLSGELDMYTAESLIRCGIAGLEASDSLTIDLSNLSFMDSTGIRAILALAERAGGSVLLRHPTANVRKVIDLTGIVGRDGIALDA